MAFELFPNAFEVFLTILQENKICIHGAKGAQHVFFLIYVLHKDIDYCFSRQHPG